MLPMESHYKETAFWDRKKEDKYQLDYRSTQDNDKMLLS